jgi:hypothetical protein
MSVRACAQSHDIVCKLSKGPSTRRDFCLRLLYATCCRVDSPTTRLRQSYMQHKKVVKILKLVLKSCDFHTFFMKK